MKCPLCGNEFEGEFWRIAMYGAERVDGYNYVCSPCFDKIDRKITDIRQGVCNVNLPPVPAISKQRVQEVHDNPCFECIWSDVEDDFAVSCYKDNCAFGPYVFERCEHFESFKEGTNGANQANR